MVKIPSRLLKVFKKNLEKEAKETEKRLGNFAQEDPFSDPDRLLDKATSDTGAKEEVSHERIEVLKEESKKNLSRIKKALAKIGIGKYGICEKCGKPIEKERLKILPTADRCARCARQKPQRN